MSLRLNKISDAAIEKDIVVNRDRVRKFLAADPQSDLRADPVRYSRRFADAATRLGLELYQQEASHSEIRSNLAVAAQNLLALPFIKSEKDFLLPIELEEALALAVCFCSPSVYENVDKFADDRFFTNSESLKIYTAMAQYLNILRIFLASGKFESGAWKKAEALCLASNAARFDARITMAKLKALSAVYAGDEVALNQAINILIEEHENEVEAGEFQRSTKVFICFPALMYAQLAAARNVICSIRSLYLPLELLG